MLKRELIGEFIGTLIIVLFGCGAIFCCVLFDSFKSLLEVALIWGFGVALAIFTSRNLSPAHLNPAVSIAMSIAGKLAPKKLPWYILSQLTGAFLGAGILYFIFSEALVDFEIAHEIIRGTPESVKTAQAFGEFFPNPGYPEIRISPFKAAILEGFGTFILVFAIFRLTEKKEQITNLTPFFIGLTVTLIICLIAPFTQAGLNPARDFGPRLFAYLAGWKDAAFPEAPFSFFYVYILGPVIGGILAAFAQRLLGKR